MIKPFGLKTARFIRRSPVEDSKLNILEGAIRSSKTWGINAKLIAMLSGAYPDWQWPGGIGLISANSKISAKTNMLNDIFAIVGEKRYRYNQQTGELNLMGKPFLVCGARDEASYKLIRGSTVGIWVADEMTIYPRSFFDMAYSRLSLSGSMMYGSTNPGSPYHYLKEDVLDNVELRSKGDLWSEHFTLDDNPNISDDVKDSYRRMYKGVFHEWYILGNWVVASGAIFKDVLTEDVFYDDSTRPVNLLSGGFQEHCVAVDAGVINPQVYVDVYDTGDQIYLDNSYYFDSVKENRQKTDREYADDLIHGCLEQGWLGFPKDQRRWPSVIVDPSAASFKAELLTRGCYVIDADNEVSAGISTVASLLGSKKLRIHRKNCAVGIKEMQTYAWNEKKTENGKEEPIHAHSHFPDAVRYYCKTKVGSWRLAA